MVPLEQAVDPAKYVVGPSDIFSVNVWLGTGFSFQSAVTPEGTLIIPTVGEVRVAGITLAEAKQRVRYRVRKRYSDGDITVTLVSPRTFIVYVTGLVDNQGPYAVTATTRVDEAILLANLPRQETDAKQGVMKSMPKNASQRNIVVRRKDGSSVKADLAMYYGTGNEAYNPTLLDGDMVFVPRKHTQENFIRVFGAVTLPDAYEFVKGDNLLDAIAVARGLSPLADSSNVELVRVDETATKSSTTRFDLRKVLAGRHPSVPLERGDRIVVYQHVVLNKDFTVGVWGEVRYPGRYPITKNTTKLSDVIRMAGEFTEHAFLQGGIVIRQEGNYDFSGVSPDFEKLMYSRSEQAEPWDRNYFLLDAQVKKRLVNVDFVRLFNDHDQSQNVVLYNGDYIYLPSIKNMVYVYGQVVNPGYVPWVEEMDFRYYIRKAGGFSNNANAGDTWVIKGRTLEWMKPGDTKVEVGDNLYVPSKQKRNFPWYVTTLSQGAAVVGAILGSIALVLQVTN
ncbi:MAG: SLBB domain-containing protein [Bacteroidota bacterium]